MTNRGKSINLYLMDGDPKERIKASLANWTGLAYRIPRTAIEMSRTIEALKQSGVYFLFGVDDTDNKNVVYVGQAGMRSNGDGLFNRIKEHKNNADKDYWTEAVIFTTSNNSFGPTEISYLENRFYNLAKAINRYDVKNGNNPSPGHITEEKESELLEFIENAKIIMGALGHNVFEPYVDNAPVNAETDTTLLQFNYKNLEATGKRTSEGFVVFSGSELSPTLAPSCSESAKRFRQKYADQINDQFSLTGDVLISSPSAAAGFVGGANLSGNVTWTNASGSTLKEIEEQEVASQEP